VNSVSLSSSSRRRALKLSMKAFCVAARRDVVPFDPHLLAPAQHRQTGELVGDAHCWLAALRDESVEFTHDPQPRQATQEVIWSGTKRRPPIGTRAIARRHATA
jgi:hypothetical protein